MVMRSLVLLTVLLTGVASAAPRAFPLAWDSETLSPGVHEVQLSVNPHIARADRYTRFDNRLGFMLGVSDRVETFTGFDLSLEFTGVPGIEEKTVEGLLTSLWHVTFLRATDVIGVSALARGSIGLTTAQLEARLIVDKQVGAARFALNSAVSRDFFWSGRTGIDFRFDEVLSARYALENFSAGVEFQARIAMKDRVFQGTGLYLGPTFTWQLTRFWVAVGFYAQVGADRAAGDTRSGTELDFRDNERFVFRVTLGARP